MHNKIKLLGVALIVFGIVAQASAQTLPAPVPPSSAQSVSPSEALMTSPPLNTRLRRVRQTPTVPSTRLAMSACLSNIPTASLSGGDVDVLWNTFKCIVREAGKLRSNYLILLDDLEDNNDNIPIIPPPLIPPPPPSPRCPITTALAPCLLNQHYEYPVVVDYMGCSIPKCVDNSPSPINQPIVIGEPVGGCAQYRGSNGQAMVWTNHGGNIGGSCTSGARPSNIVASCASNTSVTWDNNGWPTGCGTGTTYGGRIIGMCNGAPMYEGGTCNNTGSVSGGMRTVNWGSGGSSNVPSSVDDTRIASVKAVLARDCSTTTFYQYLPADMGIASCPPTGVTPNSTTGSGSPAYAPGMSSTYNYSGGSGSCPPGSYSSGSNCRTNDGALCGPFGSVSTGSFTAAQCTMGTYTPPYSGISCPSGQYSCNNVCIPNASSCTTNTTYTPPYSGSGSYSSPTTCPSGQYSCNNVCIPNASSCITTAYTPPSASPSTSGTYSGGSTYSSEPCSTGQYRDSSNKCQDMTKEMCDSANMGNSVPKWKWDGSKCQQIASAPRASLFGNVIDTLRGWFSRP